LKSAAHIREHWSIWSEKHRAMAIIAQAVRLSYDRRPYGPRDQTEPHLRIASAYLGAEAFMVTLSAAAGRAAVMLRYLIFTACRTNEVVDAGWSEIDRSSSIWKIPGERMKIDQGQETCAASEHFPTGACVARNGEAASIGAASRSHVGRDPAFACRPGPPRFTH
jgi:integrase